MAVRAQSLQQLSAQLQYLEDSIVSIIVEFSHRLATLTDLNVFVLLEGSGGRRLAGKKHLVDAFQTDSLKHDPADVRLEVTEFSNSVVALPRESPDPSNSRKRGSLERVSTNSPKRFKWSDEDEVVLLLEEEENSVDGMEKKPICIEDNSSPDVAATSVGASEYSDLGVDFDPTLSALFSSSTPDSPEYAVDFSALHLNPQKLEFLRHLDDPMEAFSKGSAAIKVISSTFFDFGKELSRFCRFGLDSPEAKTFFSVNVDRFMDSLPVMRNDSRTGIIKIQTKTPEAYMRMNARNGFRSGLGKRSIT